VVFGAQTALDDFFDPEIVIVPLLGVQITLWRASGVMAAGFTTARLEQLRARGGPLAIDLLLRTRGFDDLPLTHRPAA